MADALRTLDDLATHLGRSVKTARRALDAAMQADPGLRVTRVGRTVMFTSAQWDQALVALGLAEAPGPALACNRNAVLERRGMERETSLIFGARPYEVAGVYFLIAARRIVYVGQSRDVIARVAQHRKRIAFDAWNYVACPPDDLVALEAEYIRVLQPLHNVHGRFNG